MAARAVKISTARTRAASKFARVLDENIEKQRKQAQERLKQFRSEPIQDKPSVCAKTESERRRIWDAWTLYFEKVHGMGPEKIWIDICEDVDVTAYIRAFFQAYIENSKSDRPCLGPEEYETVQGIQSAVSIQGIWMILRGEAESGGLQRKRQEDPANREKWSVTTERHRRRGPIYMITQWIENEVPSKFDLTRQQTFEKKEMTPDDIMLLLGTLWNRASHIGCSPDVRLAFHTAVLMAGIGGFRPGELLGLTWRQVLFLVVRDPRDRSKRRLVAQVTVQHSKLKEHEIRKSQHRILLLAGALAKRAFEAGFRSFDEVLYQPDLDTVDALPLRWAAGIEDEPVLPIVYHTYWRIWKRTLFVAGLRDDKQRPYSLRVGAGGRLSGSLTEPVRNYVMGNTADVFLKSYQARHVAQNLVQVAFGEELAGDDADLFHSLQRSFLQCDPAAPLYPPEEDVKAVEDREDIRRLRAEYKRVVAETSSDHPEAKSIAARIFYVRRSLFAQIMVDERRKYFVEADKLRASGQPGPGPRSQDVNPFRACDPQGALAAELIGQFMQSDGKGYKRESIRPADVYLAYLQRRPQEVAVLLQRGAASTPTSPLIIQPKEPLPDSSKPHRCLFGCGLFPNRGNLTRHSTRVHFEKGTFDTPFYCPECRRLGMRDHTIDGPMEWSNHIASNHDPRHAPSLPPNLLSRPGASWIKEAPYWQLAKGQGPCLVCGDILENAGAFVRHFKQLHVAKQELFKEPFLCQACTRQNLPPRRIENAADWQAHLADTHEGGGPFGQLHSPSSEPFRKKRSRAKAPEHDFSPDIELRSQKRRKTAFAPNINEADSASCSVLDGEVAIEAEEDVALSFPDLAGPPSELDLSLIDPLLLGANGCTPLANEGNGSATLVHT
ncbi:hypothetical protein DL768_011750 [Monosporascus sp. mg162]|nr:hypothetical protein DL768_011750 [Monosporascus sp. mg162]